MKGKEKIFIVIDVILMISLIGIYGYTTYVVKRYEESFEERCRSLYLNVEPEWIKELILNQTFDNTLSELNISD